MTRAVSFRVRRCAATRRNPRAADCPLALTGTPTSASRWLSSRSWTARRRARLDQRTGEAERPPGRPHRTALAIALTSGSISRGERPPPCRPRAKLEKLVRDRRGGSSAAVPDQHSPSSMIRRRRLSQVAQGRSVGVVRGGTTSWTHNLAQEARARGTRGLVSTRPRLRTEHGVRLVSADEAARLRGQ